MLVYGDPSSVEPPARSIRRVCDRLEALIARTRPGHPPPLDDLRAFLIHAGQLEQAADDAADVDRSVSDALLALTDHAARAFVAHPHAGLEGPSGDLARGIAGARSLVSDLLRIPTTHWTVKTPEGYAFYALYPEQYAHAARRWARDHPDAGLTLVVGLRSIGTSLSAVVAQALQRLGHPATRLTLRPAGDPFGRRASIDPRRIAGTTYALVVDEGPGLSGSSMAAAGAALAGAGIDRRNIAFLPAHENGPGPAASDETRTWWNTTPAYTTSLDETRWSGLTLAEHLAARTADLFDVRFDQVTVQDLSAGRWRPHAFESSTQWPATCTSFERTKYRCTSPDGRALLWKFAGLTPDAESIADQQSRLAAAGWTAAPVDRTLGFVATDWVEGRPHSRADGAPGLLTHIGRYVTAASALVPPLDFDEQRKSFDRLAEMIAVNIEKTLGEPGATRARERVEAARPSSSSRPIPAYADGRLAPHEWLRTPDHRVLKLDCAGHTADHTLVGRQPLAWDLAGALIEWNLSPDEARPLLDAADSPVGDLDFHRLAYATFRMGMCLLCADMTPHDHEEQSRLRRAASFYRDTVARLI